jgi:hypothetical protein
MRSKVFHPFDLSIAKELDAKSEEILKLLEGFSLFEVELFFKRILDKKIKATKF